MRNNIEDLITALEFHHDENNTHDLETVPCF
jgi:hypothetical protein